MGRIKRTAAGSATSLTLTTSSSFALIVLLAFLFMILSPADGHDHGHAGKRVRVVTRPWPCCNSCGGCTKSIPPRCQCRDLVQSCHPMCQNCVKYPLSANPPLYQCMDLIPNFCKYNCTASSASILTQTQTQVQGQ